MKVPVLIVSLFAAISCAFGETLEERAAKTIIPKFRVEGASPNEAFATLSALTGLAIECADPAKDEPRITLSLENVPAKVAIQYVADLGRMRVEYGADQVKVTKKLK